MVAVQDKILKATKMLPSNLSWNGKPDTLASFVERFEEWVEIRMGAEAALVLAGKQHDENGDATMASCMYTTWSQELYLLLRGRLAKDCADADAAAESMLASKDAIQRSAFNLLQHWSRLGEAKTKLDCDEIDIKLEGLRISLEDDRAVVLTKAAHAKRQWERKPDRYRGSEDDLESVLLGLLPPACAAWREDYVRTIETNETLYNMERPGYDAIVMALQTAVGRRVCGQCGKTAQNAGRACRPVSGHATRASQHAGSCRQMQRAEGGFGAGGQSPPLHTNNSRPLKLE